MVNFLKSFIRDESGATAIEYALIAAVLGVGILAAAQALQGAVNGRLGFASGQLATAQ